MNYHQVICFMSSLLFIGCSQQEKSKSILPDDFQLKTGDVVFRRGGGLTSQVVLATDINGNYSHLGIVVDSAGIKMVVHAVPGEPDYDGDEDRVKMDKPEHFFSTSLTTIGEVCRPRDSIIGKEAAETAMRLYKKHTLFDHNYDEGDTTKMYCTELVTYAYRMAGHELIGKERHKVNLPFLKVECIFPSDIYSSEFLESIILFHK